MLEVLEGSERSDVLSPERGDCGLWKIGRILVQQLGSKELLLSAL